MRKRMGFQVVHKQRPQRMTSLGFQKQVVPVHFHLLNALVSCRDRNSNECVVHLFTKLFVACQHGGFAF